MSARICSISGCSKPHKAYGLCGTHYARQHKTGDAGPAESLRTPKPLPLCAAPDCETLARSSGALYCEMHYGRMRRNGQLDPVIERLQTGGPCLAENCDDIAVDIGMCATHARRVRRHGDPQVCIEPENRKKLLGPGNPSWVGDEIGYDGAHGRVEAARGKATDHACVDCGKPARHWSYDHADPNERVGATGAYSTDPDHYVPRCVSCHKVFDLSIKRGAA